MLKLSFFATWPSDHSPFSISPNQTGCIIIFCIYLYTPYHTIPSLITLLSKLKPSFSSSSPNSHTILQNDLNNIPTSTSTTPNSLSLSNRSGDVSRPSTCPKAYRSHLLSR